MCIKTFCFLHTLSSSQSKRALKLMDCPHKRPYAKPRHALRLADIKYVVSLVRNYAENNAILLPGRIPGYKRDDLVLLPSLTTKIAVWNVYHTAAGSARDVKAVGYSSFCSLWNQPLPHILVCKPMSDLCWTCQQNSTMIMRAHNRPEEEKSEVGLPLYSIQCVFLFNAHSLPLSFPFLSLPPLPLSLFLSFSLFLGCAEGRGASAVSNAGALSV